MTSHHFFVEPTAVANDNVTLEGEEAHHAGRVLRVRPGEEITVADDTGRVVRAEVSSIGGVVEARVVACTRVDAPRPSIVLFQALTKGDKLDGIIEKAAEVGVRRVVPFVAARTIVRWDASKMERMTQRWSAIARAAAKQSKSPWLLRVDNVSPSLDEVLPSSGLSLVMHEGGRRRLRDALPAEAPDTLTLVVGPEGGFSDDEVSRLSEQGAEVVTLGPRVLRTETAGLVAAAVVGYAYGYLG